MKTKNILILNILLLPFLAALFFHDRKTFIFDFSFDIDRGWINLMIIISYFSIPANIIYCLFIIFREKENWRSAIKYSIVGILTALTTGVFVMFWLAGLMAMLVE
jgi:hypothetical protein